MFTVLKISSVVPPEAFVCEDLPEALRLLDGVRTVMAGTPVVIDTERHLSYRSPHGATWAFTIIDRALMSPHWKSTMEVTA